MLAESLKVDSMDLTSEQENKFICKLYIHSSPFKKQNLGTIRIKTDAKSLEKMKTNLSLGYLKILT